MAQDTQGYIVSVFSKSGSPIFTVPPEEDILLASTAFSAIVGVLDKVGSLKVDFFKTSGGIAFFHQLGNVGTVMLFIPDSENEQEIRWMVEVFANDIVDSLALYDDASASAVEGIQHMYSDFLSNLLRANQLVKDITQKYATGFALIGVEATSILAASASDLLVVDEKRLYINSDVTSKGKFRSEQVISLLENALSTLTARLKEMV